MREGSRTGFRPNRARSQRVQSNSVMSLRAGPSLKGMDGRRLNSERGPLYIDSRYEINDLKENQDRCQEKLLDFFIALRREIEDEDFLTQCRHWMKKTEKRTTHRKGIPQGAPIPPGKHLSARSRPIEKKKNAKKVNIKKMLWECEIRGRGVRSRTTAGASSSDS